MCEQVGICFFATFGALFHLLLSFIQIQSDHFLFSVIMYYFVMFGCYSLDVCSFQMRNRKGEDPDERGGGEEQGRIEGWETEIMVYCMRK